MLMPPHDWPAPSVRLGPNEPVIHVAVSLLVGAAPVVQLASAARSVPTAALSTACTLPTQKIAAASRVIATMPRVDARTDARMPMVGRRRGSVAILLVNDSPDLSF